MRTRYFGKVGMCYFHKTMNKFHCPIVNVDHLFLLLPDSAKSAPKRKGPLLDVTPFGYFKVLGKGNAPPTPLVVKSNFFSKIAEKKIKEGILQYRGSYCNSPSPADAYATDCNDEEEHVAEDIAMNMRSTISINTVTASILKGVSVMKAKILLQSANGGISRSRDSL
ncbi:hypothetical protein GOP47_0006438 [Adiantum capillus-veneris]|uniref:Large ribosomal subunit protein uL15/eL18 domain-containing protein n=1 Tax=Adiantum capillus-veneris TaxID=13818 RepID=A0A9D4V3P0_ADICA|nr:hypothetical protein GOP47_0006438 [Adiantum capillus-veneris]